MANLRQRVGGLAATPLFLVTWFWPTTLPELQQRLLAILVTVMCLWVSEALPISATAMLIAPTLVAAQITNARTAFASYADPLVFLFYGAFFIAAAMERHGLNRRLAGALTTLPGLQGRGALTRLAIMLTGVLLSMWISNTATTAILVPIVLGALRGEGVKGMTAGAREKAQVGGLLAVAYACSVGGIGAIVGTPPNLIAVRLLAEAGLPLSFFEYSMIGLPVALTLALVIFAALTTSHPAPNKVHTQSTGHQPWTRGEALTALSLGLAILGFIAPALLTALGIGDGQANKVLPPAGAAMLATAPLFFLHDEKGELVLPWDEARKVDWGIIMLFGGGIALGVQMFDTGLAETLGRGFIELTGVRDVWALTALAIAFTLFFTEVCSNTATANMLIPLILGVTTELDLPPVAPVLGIACAASCAFMMPIATGPNAIVYGTGLIPLPTMNRVGLTLNVLCAVTIFALLRLLCPLYGWS